MPAKTPLLDKLIAQLNSKKANYLEHVIKKAKKLSYNVIHSSADEDSREWEQLYAKYDIERNYIRGYLRALYDTGIISTYKKLDEIEDEIDLLIDDSEGDVG